MSSSSNPDPLTGEYAEMTMLIGGAWQAAANGRTEDVTSPFDGTVTGEAERVEETIRRAVDEGVKLKA